MAVHDRRNPPPSPCDNTCVVDRRHNCCAGCFRMLDEVAMWNAMSAEEQWAVVDQLGSRRARMEADGPGPQ